MKNEINREDLHVQLQEIYKCEKGLEEDRNNHNFDLVRKENILARLGLATHEIYLILKDSHK